MSAEWSCHALPGCNEEPQARGQDDVIDDLREARRSYSTLSDASLLDVLSLVTKHLSVTRPEKIYVTFPNGRKWTYGREVTPIKTVVGPRQTRRRASLAAAAVGRLVQIDVGLVTAMMQDLCLRAQQSGGVAVVPTAMALTPTPVRMQTQFILDNNISGSLWQMVQLFMGGPSSGLASRESMRADLHKAQAEPRSQARMDGKVPFWLRLRRRYRGYWTTCWLATYLLRGLCVARMGRRLRPWTRLKVRASRQAYTRRRCATCSCASASTRAD